MAEVRESRGSELVSKYRRLLRFTEPRSQAFAGTRPCTLNRDGLHRAEEVGVFRCRCGERAGR